MKVATFNEDFLLNNEVVEYSKLIQYLKDLNFNCGIISNVGNQNLESELLNKYPNLINFFI